MPHLSVTRKTVAVEHQAAALDPSCFALHAVKPLTIISNKIVLMSVPERQRNQIPCFN